MNRFFGTFITGRAAVGLLAVRLVTGAAFIIHGWQKIRSPGGAFGWMGPDSGVPGVFQAGAALSEFGGGILLILGLLTPLAALAITGVMIGALAMVHLPQGHPFVGRPGEHSFELAAAYLANAIMLLLVGPGALSVDARLFAKR